MRYRKFLLTNRKSSSVPEKRTLPVPLLTFFGRFIQSVNTFLRVSLFVYCSYTGQWLSREHVDIASHKVLQTTWCKIWAISCMSKNFKSVVPRLTCKHVRYRAVTGFPYPGVFTYLSLPQTDIWSQSRYISKSSEANFTILLFSVWRKRTNTNELKPCTAWVFRLHTACYRLVLMSRDTETNWTIRSASSVKRFCFAGSSLVIKGQQQPSPMVLIF